MPRSAWQDSVAAHKERTRAAILDAAAGLVASQGATGLVMTSLARRARISRATLYNYFPDVEQVLEALVQAQVDEFTRELDRRLDGVADPAERLRRALAALTAWAGDQAALRPAGSRRQPAPNQALVGRIHRPLGALRDRLAALIAGAAEAGRLPPGTDPAMATRIVLALVFGAREQLGPAGQPGLAGTMLTFLLRGLGLADLAGDLDSTHPGPG
jgi:AcrR family transcriptional regulator